MELLIPPIKTQQRQILTLTPISIQIFFRCGVTACGINITDMQQSDGYYEMWW